MGDKESAEPIVLPSGGHPWIVKGESDAPVRAHIAAMPGRMPGVLG